MNGRCKRKHARIINTKNYHFDIFLYRIVPYVPDKDEKVDLLNFINQSIATQIETSVSQQINLSFENRKQATLPPDFSINF